MKRIRTSLFIFLAVACGPGLAFAAAEDEPGDGPAPEPSPEDCSIPIYPDKLWLSATGGSPDVSDTIVIWQDDDGGNLDIWTYDIETCVTSNLTDSIPDEEGMPATGGNIRVWVENLFSLQYRKLPSTSRQISSSLGGIEAPSVADDWVVWSETPLSIDGSDWDIYLWDGSKTKVSQDPDFENAGHPDTDGEDVVWEAEGTNWDIFRWDGTFPIDEDSSDNLTAASDAFATEFASGPRDDLSPRISEGRVVWARCLRSDHEDCTIRIRSLDSGSSFGTSISSEGTNPDVSSRGVVYQKKTEYVWEGGDVTYPTAIHFWDGSETEQISLLGTKRNPRIHGDNIVWETSGGGIFFTQLPEPSAPILGIVVLTALATGRRLSHRSRSALSQVS